MSISGSNPRPLLPFPGMLAGLDALGQDDPPDGPAICASEPCCAPEAMHLSLALGLPMLPPGAADDARTPADRVLLVVTPERLELRQTGRRAPGPVWCEFLGSLRRELAGPGAGRRRDLARAMGLSQGAEGSVVDATAGLGRDAFRLASLGCPVIAVERSPPVAALLADGLRRAAASSGAAATAARRIRLVPGDARQVLHADPAPDVVLIDPMYPPARKQAAPGKELALLRRLIGFDDDAGELLATARAVARRRVVVKRRAHDPPLDGASPDRSWTGRSTRFDVYLAAHRGNLR